MKPLCSDTSSDSGFRLVPPVKGLHVPHTHTRMHLSQNEEIHKIMKRWSLKMRLCCKVFDRLNKQRVQIEHRGVLMSSGSSGAAPQMCNSP